MAQATSSIQQLTRRRAQTTAAAEIVGALGAAGVSRVFGIPGGPISPFVDATLDSDIEFVAFQQETMAVYCAIGYARATGAPAEV